MKEREKEGREERGVRLRRFYRPKFGIDIKIGEREDGDEIINNVTIIRSNIV